MNEKLKALNEGIDAAYFRGHALDKYEKVVAGNGQTFYDVFCGRCGMEWRFTPEPQPNQCLVSGEALALHCNEPRDIDEELTDYQKVVGDLFNLL